MSTDRSLNQPRAGYLLLRDGHAVPLAGISPLEIKAGAKHRVPHPDAEPIKHRQTLTAIVSRLGFRGDWGDYQNSGWPQFEELLREHGCTERSGLFPADHGGSYDLFFTGTSGPTRRQLADRIFESPLDVPSRVFLGHGVDWGAVDRIRFGGSREGLTSGTTGQADSGDSISRLFDGPAAPRFALIGQWGFLDDKLVHGPATHIVDKSYWPKGTEESARAESLDEVTTAVRAFRALFDGSDVGWVDVLRFNDRLVVLRGHDGTWDVLWRGYRDEEPPQPSDVGRSHYLAVEDLPSRLMTESDLRRSVHFRQNVWEEHEAHEAEQAFYDRGGSAQQRRLTSDAEVRIAWLREQGRLVMPGRTRWDGTPPAGFRTVIVNGRKLAMTELIEVGPFRQMLVETGYATRRVDDREPWERANEVPSNKAPVGAAWVDAQAFCAWMERQLGVALRLPTREELRALRPAYSSHYASMANLDFPWENHPPRPLVGDDAENAAREVPSAVEWSEPRFLEPAPGRPSHPGPDGRSTTSRKRWIEDFPPRAAWKEELPWAAHGGLKFIDAWDAYEWCQEWGWISGRFWEGHIGPTSWGAYKNVKVTFRVVMDLEG